MAKKATPKKSKAKDSPFGEASRVEILESHLHEFGVVTAESAWRFVYEE
jgi:hypothetical protein